MCSSRLRSGGTCRGCFFSSRRRHTRYWRDWSSDVCSSDPGVTFLVGLAAAVGAGISMGFSEGLSDDGSLTGRGSPVLRGGITGVATFVGGILHTLPFLIPHVNVALYVAFGVVGFELLAISFIRYRYFRMGLVLSILQVFVGGALVFLAGVFIGSA